MLGIHPHTHTHKGPVMRKMCSCHYVVMERYVCASKMLGAKPLPGSILTVLSFITMRLAYIRPWIESPLVQAVLCYIFGAYPLPEPILTVNNALRNKLLWNINQNITFVKSMYLKCSLKISHIWSRRHCGKRPVTREVLICHDVNNGPFY